MVEAYFVRPTATAQLSPPTIKGPAGLRLARILVPVDFSAGAFTALRHAAALADICRADLVLLHVVQLNIGGEELGVPRARFLNEMADQARAQLRRWVAASLPGNALVRIVIAEGRPSEEIVMQAEELSADLIVLFAHRFGGLLRLLPHTAARVVEHAPCPVMIISSTPKWSEP